MRPFAFVPGHADVGCCPGHDWPRCYRWAGRYSSAASKRTDAKRNRRAKRIRRHLDRALLSGRLVDLDDLR